MFKITIEQTRDEPIHKGKQWSLLMVGGEYGYTPETDTVESVRRTIYEQTVDVLDVKSVIAVVNGIKQAQESS